MANDNETRTQDITVLSVIELKALIYDLIVQESQCRANIETMRAELARRAKP